MWGKRQKNWGEKIIKRTVWRETKNTGDGLWLQNWRVKGRKKGGKWVGGVSDKVVDVEDEGNKLNFLRGSSEKKRTENVSKGTSHHEENKGTQVGNVNERSSKI